MNRLGIESLNAGAPDLRLSGDHTQRGTYTQRRRDQMAYGGIAGLDGRKRYWLGSKFQEWIKDPLERLFTGKTQDQIDSESQMRVDRQDQVVRMDPRTGKQFDLSTYDPAIDPPLNDDNFPPISSGPAYTPFYEQIFKGSDSNQENALGFNVGDIFGLGKDQYGKYTIPMGIGAAMGKLQQDYLDKQPPFPADETGIKFQTGAEAMADPNLRFKPEAQYANVAEGGRIGYSLGKSVEKQKDIFRSFSNYKSGGGKKDFVGWYNDVYISDEMVEMPRAYAAPAEEEWPYGYAEPGTIGSPEAIGIEYNAQGGRIGAQEGGLMNLGGMEKDYREEGGFVPIGGQEKADDVPARLSKNEFVFTADAVRGAGGGDIDKGAEIMEDLMNNLEGARGMFANAQKLQNRII